MLNVRVITLAVTLAFSGAALIGAPLASANGPVAAATATEDDNGVHAQPGDDNGVHAQPADDNGIHAQPADDNGVHAQPADDNGIHAQPADDKSVDVTASAAAGAMKAKTAARAKRHAHIRRASHRVAR